ncbi:MAG: PfkB family carbohydrate kinase [Anaerolineales bacterium]|nr:PfkB family carbohydrate kinase [Anaerolineales bacterium]
MFDIAFVGHFTKDTIENSQGSAVHRGGAYYYGAHVATRMGLQVAVVTRIAKEDWGAIEELQAMGVTMYARETPESTCLRIVYPTANLDERVIYATGFAGAFTPAEIAPIDARVFHVGASIRGEVPVNVIAALAAKKARVSLDVQGFIRVNENGTLKYAKWPEMSTVLHLINVLKVDSTEAEFLAGTKDMRDAIRFFAAYGPQEIVLTQNTGVMVYADGKVYEYPWRVREIKGRTGRGDTCTSAYLCKRLTASPEEAARFTAALTGAKLEAPGPFKGEVPKEY